MAEMKNLRNELTNHLQILQIEDGKNADSIIDLKSQRSIEDSK